LAGWCRIGGHGRWLGVRGKGVGVGGSARRAGRRDSAGGGESWLAVEVLGGEQGRATQENQGEQTDSDDFPVFVFLQGKKEFDEAGWGIWV